MSEVTKHNIPTAVSVKPVLALIRDHANHDDAGVLKAALEIARELELSDKQELADYIYAQFRLIPTFEVTD